MAESVATESFDSLRLTDRQVRELLLTREKQRLAMGGAPLRGLVGRFPDGCRLSIEIGDASSGTQRHAVIGLTITETGVSIMTGRYIHDKSEVAVGLTTLEGEPVLLPGVVTHCRLVEGRVHEAGIRFREDIDPRDYVTKTREIAPPDEDGCEQSEAPVEVKVQGEPEAPETPRLDRVALAQCAMALAQASLAGDAEARLREMMGVITEALKPS